MEEKLSDRAQVYWETIPVGETIDADQLFEVTRRPKDLGQDIKYVRSFLAQKFNEGVAFLSPGQSPPVYTKLSNEISVSKLCTMIFNALPLGEKMTTYSFNNHLPQKLRNLKTVGNFFHRAKICGAISNIINGSGEKRKVKEANSAFLLVEKKASIIGLPPMGKIPRIGHKQMDLPIKAKIPSYQITSKIFDMKTSEVGLSIFELLHQLMIENESQQTKINDLTKSLKDSQIENKKLTEELHIHGMKDLTYAEIYRKTNRT